MLPSEQAFMLPLLLLGAEGWSQAPVQTLLHGPPPRKQGARAGNPDSLVTNDLMPPLPFEEGKKISPPPNFLPSYMLIRSET